MQKSTFQSESHPPPSSHSTRTPYRNHPNTSSISLNPSPPPPLPLKSSSMPLNPQPIDFDEGVLRTLCGLECGFPLVIDRLKQAVGTSREVGLFLKKKAQLEEEYGTKLAKLAKERLEAYSHLGGEVKAGSFGKQYSNFLTTHERMAIERTEYGNRLSSIADELANLSKEVERVRKANKDVGWRLEKNLVESEGLTEKAKAKFDVTVEELERVLMSKQADGGSHSGSTNTGFNSNSSSSTSQNKSAAPAKGIGKAISKLAAKTTKSVGQLAKTEDEVRSRMSAVSDVYRSQVLATQQVRQEYFNLQLPRILRTLKEHSDETDLAIQYFLSNYSTLSESLLVNEALSVSALPADHRKASVDDSTGSVNLDAENPGGPSSTGPWGLKDIIQSIDNRADFREYMANYAAYFNQTHFAQLTSQSGSTLPSSSLGNHLPPSAQIPSLPTSLQSGSHGFNPQQQHNKVVGQHGGDSPRTSIGSTPLTIDRRTFGVDLATQMMRDGIETVPKVVEKCVKAIEKAGGIDMVGIYRLSGTTSKIARLKQRFDTDIDNVKLEVGDENQSEINDIAGVMKLWFRELPEPLLTWNLYGSFIEAGRIENNRLRHIRLHERVNELPDPNYATLKYLMGHLDKIRRNEALNSMGASNLAVIFGPTLLSSPPINFYHHHQLYNPEGAPNSNPNPPGSNSLSANGSNTSTHNNGVSPGLSSANNAFQDMSIQCKVIETILEHYREIFVDEGEEENEEDLTSGTGAGEVTSASLGGEGGGATTESIMSANNPPGSDPSVAVGSLNEPVDADTSAELHHPPVENLKPWPK